MDILEKAQEMEQAGKHVIHLEVGQPDFETPACVVEAANKAMQDKKTGYTHSLGILPLREAIAEYYALEYKVAVSPEQIVVTSGSSPAMFMLFSMLCESGDEVILADPTYACYENFVRFAGAEVIHVAAAEDAGFQLAPKAVHKAVTAKTRAIIVNSPSNPAGTLLSRQDMQELASIGPRLVSDEIYHGLVYEGNAVSALEISPEACVLDGFSKRYAMTGWRLGWMVVPRGFVQVLQVMQQNFFISANSISQWAGIAALKYAAADVKRMVSEYARRRLLILERLRALGFGIRSHPVGAFYVLADARHLVQNARTPNSLTLAFDILEKAQVGVAPGIDFGPGAEGYLRFSYASSLENIEEAMHRLKRYMENR